ncbi:MAG: ATP-binding protein, partial [Phycisphaerae bacterium]
TSHLSSPTVHTFGLQAGLEELAEEFSEEHNIECRFHGTEDKKILEKNVRLLFYRSVKELLCNIAKHADANSVDINIDSDGEYFRVVVADDGKGFDVAEWSSSGKDKGFGLYSIKQRLTNVRGSFSIVSEKEKGTKVVLEAPLNDDRTHGRR